MEAQCTKPTPGFICHKEGGYDKKHYQCKPCRFNSVAEYKKELDRKRAENEN
jgi:transposase-like protein